MVGRFIVLAIVALASSGCVPTASRPSGVAPSGSPATQAGLLVHLVMGGAATDQGPHHLAVTVAGQAPRFEAGPGGNYALIDGTRGFLEVDMGPPVDFSRGLTLQVRFRRDPWNSPDGSPQCLARVGVAGLVLTHEGALVATVSMLGEAGQPVTALTSTDEYRAPVAQWASAALVVEPASQRMLIYADGRKQAEFHHVSHPLGSSPPSPLRIGAHGTKENPFRGGIAEVQLYNRARTETEIVAAQAR